jgi:GrpB-like predicted nucleotidyltransferase (UPF0157 family)
MIVIRDYDTNWPETFEQLRSRVWPAVSDAALVIEHVGSTSVPGLAAKPVIDISVVVRSSEDTPGAIQGLTTLGYVHLGDRGIEGREAFASPGGLAAHHLYVCPRGSLGLANQLALRDFLRMNPDVAHEYGILKKGLAKRFPNDIDRYVDGKTDFIVAILNRSGFTPEQLESIEQANRSVV